ncbi:MAG: hypothetical protein IJP75_09065 [Bacteroidaceae bacterium]|nr:hypothetical protein [Bacteroidaceae bacterium]
MTILMGMLMGGVNHAIAQAPNEKQMATAVTEPVKHTFKAPAGKEIYIPKDMKENDFTDAESKWSYARCAYTEDVIIFWEKPFGQDLSKAPDLDGHNMKVDLRNLLLRIQSFYDFYKDELEFIKPGSNADRYRMMVMLNYSLEGTAYGGDYDGVIGALWIAPNRVQDKKLNCIAHELGHSFQSMIACDKQGESWGGGGIFEMTSQWMLWNVNPEWPTDENYHWKAFIDHANLRFLDGENIYHSPYLLEYWSMKHGKTVIGNLFRNGKRGEDPASTYMKMFNMTNEDFAKEAVDCYSRLLTFDFPGKHEMNKKYAGEFVNNKPLQVFGANVIKIDTKGKRVAKVKFTGNGKEDGFAYRLVAVNERAHATYGDICTKKKGTATLNLPADTRDVYLVVTAYPLGEYKPYTFNPYSGEKPEAPHIYTYNIK